MSGECAAITADFAWFSQRCGQPAVGVVNQDGTDWSVCAEHMPVGAS